GNGGDAARRRHRDGASGRRSIGAGARRDDSSRHDWRGHRRDGDARPDDDALNDRCRRQASLLSGSGAELKSQRRITMEYRRLGRTGLKVSTICLGTMQFGWSSGEDVAHRVMSRAVELGCNFFDTADVYSRWIEGNPGGVSETIIGNWLQKTSARREDLIIATKVRGAMSDDVNDRGLSRHHIMNAVENSLRRLQTDYIDLYQTHAFEA